MAALAEAKESNRREEPCGFGGHASALSDEDLMNKQVVGPDPDSQRNFNFERTKRNVYETERLSPDRDSHGENTCLL